MKTSRYILLMLGIVGLWSCSGGVMPVSEPQVVVEGWIENGAAPIVIVTSTVPVTEEIKDVNELRQYIVTWAKVTVSNGTESVILTGQKDNDYFPPYIYTTSRMKGEAGKSYTITVECSGRKATATTTIPEPVALEYVKATRSSEDDGKILLTAGLKDNAQEKNYYKSFVKIKGKDTYYHPSFMGLIDDEVLEEEVEEIPINNGPNSLTGKRDPYFEPTDTVTVRFCTMDKASFDYWTDFDTISSLSRNPFFPSTDKMRSNVSGGLGYWAGYGTTYHTVTIPDCLEE